MRRALSMLERDGRSWHFGVTVSPLGDPACPARRHLPLLRSDDVVELEEQLQLKEALARLGELTAGIAHEFRNGLATIHGYSRLIDPEALPAQYRPYVEGIRQETDALGRVVTNFLNFARPEQVVARARGPRADGAAGGGRSSSSSCRRARRSTSRATFGADRRRRGAAAADVRESDSECRRSLRGWRARTPAIVDRRACRRGATADASSPSTTTVPASRRPTAAGSSSRSSRRDRAAADSGCRSSRRSCFCTTARSPSAFTLCRRASSADIPADMKPAHGLLSAPAPATHELCDWASQGETRRADQVLAASRAT